MFQHTSATESFQFGKLKETLDTHADNHTHCFFLQFHAIVMLHKFNALQKKPKVQGYKCSQSGRERDREQCFIFVLLMHTMQCMAQQMKNIIKRYNNLIPGRDTIPLSLSHSWIQKRTISISSLYMRLRNLVFKFDFSGQVLQIPGSIKNVKFHSKYFENGCYSLFFVVLFIHGELLWVQFNENPSTWKIPGVRNFLCDECMDALLLWVVNLVQTHLITYFMLWRWLN